jgi:hypothetical protein
MTESTIGCQWRIIDVQAAGHSLYELELELGDGDAYAHALVAVGDRAARGTHEPADWAVRVELCSDDSARDWLWCHEHEYMIGRLCVTGYAP